MLEKTNRVLTEEINYLEDWLIVDILDSSSDNLHSAPNNISLWRKKNIVIYAAPHPLKVFSKILQPQNSLH